MKLTFISNACCMYESQNYQILCDPWLTDGAFYGSWTHDPPLKTRPEDVADYHALYISHLHPDHFDPGTLQYFNKMKPVIILDREPNYLERMLKAESFLNIVKIKDGASAQFGPFTVTMFGPFQGIPFHDNQLGNPIDSAIVVDDGKHKIFNANDNTPSLGAAKMLKQRFGTIDIAQLNYNNAGPYPACFGNLSEAEKLTEAHRLVDRNVDHVIDLCHILKPLYFMPFAGAYRLKGKLSVKNSYLGTTLPEYAGKHVSLHLDIPYLIIGEGNSFEL